ncbi:MAG TPA: LacI family DNA-binding transcriptional regulator [Arachnia sp.]|nr:LacI family DNA-binding transcriptional regulator [Arachnia sp.]
MSKPQGRATRQPSMADVGRHAEVSAQTVSRYFTGGYLSDETRQRVEEAISELGYRRNHLPRSLRRSRTDTIGYLAIGPLNFGSGGILTGLSRAARAAGQSLLTTQLSQGPEAQGSLEEAHRALETFLSLRVDGIVVGTPYRDLEQVLEFIGKAVPVIAATELVSAPVDCVRVDSHHAGTLAVEHLAALGHTRILHLGGPPATNEAAERRRGYEETMARLGLPILPVVSCSAWTADAAAEAAGELDPSGFTAVFAANDLLALGLTSHLHGKGLTCPDDFSIVGVDDMPETAFYTPPLTTARIDFELVGETACAALLERIRTGQRQQLSTVGTQLTVRASTAPPRQEA